MVHNGEILLNGYVVFFGVTGSTGIGRGSGCRVLLVAVLKMDDFMLCKFHLYRVKKDKTKAKPCPFCLVQL